MIWLRFQKPNHWWFSVRHLPLRRDNQGLFPGCWFRALYNVCVLGLSIYWSKEKRIPKEEKSHYNFVNCNTSFNLALEEYEAFEICHNWYMLDTTAWLIPKNPCNIDSKTGVKLSFSLFMIGKGVLCDKSPEVGTYSVSQPKVVGFSHVTIQNKRS